MTTLKTKFLCPLSGSEWTYNQHRKIFKTNIQGSNCYSYALNHPESNGVRHKKAVPGDIALALNNIKHKYTDWQSCDNAIDRILDDGMAISQKRKYKHNVIKKVPGKLKEQMKAKSPVGWRKFVLVVDSLGEPKGVSTDFHFYAQNKISIDKLYNIPRVTSLCCGRKIMINPYNIIDVNAFVSDDHIKRKLRNLEKTNNMSKTNRVALKRLLNDRAFENIKLHEDMIPEYAHSFIVDPWWIFNLSYFDRNKEHLEEEYRRLHEKCNKLNSSKAINYILIINHAKKDCLELLDSKKVLEPKYTNIGLWSHKLGWGTEPLNTDGLGKIIFDPTLPEPLVYRHHGGYKYNVACQAFFVLRGHGFTSV